jgi:GT2 family glycosyltransferase
MTQHPPTPSSHHPIIPSTPPPPTLSVIILSHNRREALLHTLTDLAPLTKRARQEASPTSDSAPAPAPAPLISELILVDNASADGTLDAVRQCFAHLLDPGPLRILGLPENLAIEGFNRGADLALGEFLLILDDDARPDPASLASALDLLRSDPTLAGVALLPIHPRTNIPEWRFATPGTLLRDFPAFGCANLVRASAWRVVGGYQREFFLYRNDVDLALKFLGAGLGVAHNPAWFAWHDSPAAAKKSSRWLRLATRNWAWLARRHTPRSFLNSRTLATIALQFAWTLRQAGLDVDRLTQACEGLREGLTTPPPALPAGVRKTDGLWRLVKMLVKRK